MIPTRAAFCRVRFNRVVFPFWPSPILQRRQLQTRTRVRLVCCTFGLPILPAELGIVRPSHFGRPFWHFVKAPSLAWDHLEILDQLPCSVPLPAAHQT